MGVRIVPKFDISSIKAYMDQYEKEVIRQNLVNKFIYAGERFYELAQKNAEFQNHTYDLRSSMGFMVVENGKVLAERFESKGDSKDGERIGRDLALAVGKELPKDQIGLIGVAGMGYAAAVESKNYDVISDSSRETKNILLRALKIS